ncbi:hypothetical protein PVAG01_01277 [Phlyctema vagabunda]|uniref:Uncharacterized protein n=1 Tax=Phlyctema vagabunda TaxID=108571 RepID=A0ABR4PWM9_9HELO
MSSGAWALTNELAALDQQASQEHGVRPWARFVGGGKTASCFGASSSLRVENFLFSLVMQNPTARLCKAQGTEA